jgi:hypothetical protein
MIISHAKKLAGAATAAAAIGLMVTPGPAQAAPANCDGYQFPGGRVTIFYPNIKAQTQFDTIAGGTHVDTQATTVYPQSSMPGTVIGDINGNNIHLEVTRQGVQREYPPLILDGAVGPDDRGHGTYTYEQGSGNWDSDAPMKCIAKAQAPPPAAATSATVIGGDADVFNIAHNDVPDPVNGIQGAKLATLPDGTQVGLEGPCKAGWCRVNEASIPQGFGFVEQGHLQIG